MIRDIGSTNGTFVSGQRVEAGPLNWEDPFRVGNVECILRRETTSIGVQRPRTRHPARKIDREGYKALAIGLGLAVVVCLVPFLAYIIDLLRVIIQGGHTVTAWLLGYPTIPMLTPGGGVAAQLARPTWMIVLLLVGLGKVLYDTYRGRRYVLPVSIAAGI